MGNWEGFDKKKQHSNKRQAIIHEAAIAFNEGGYQGTSLDTIAKRLGVTKKALYYYVKNKQEILYEIFCQWADVQQTAIQQAMESSDDPIDQLRHYSANYVVAVFEQLTPMDRMAGEIDTLDEDSINYIRIRRKDNDKALVKIVEAAIANGSAQPLVAQMFINTLNGSLDWVFKWCKPDTKSAKMAAIETFDILAKGLETR